MREVRILAKSFHWTQDANPEPFLPQKF